MLAVGALAAAAPADAAPGSPGAAPGSPGAAPGSAGADANAARSFAAGPRPGAQPGTPQTRTVTLITGDRVRVTGKRVAVLPAAGRRGVPMLTSQVRGHTFVVPADAEPLVQRGTLDRQLFDVTELLGSGYDDASSKGVPLIVQYAGGSRAAGARKALTSAGGRQGRTFGSIGATAVTQPKASTAALWRTLAGPPAARAARAFTPAVRRVWLDRKATLSLDVSVPQIKAPAAWAAGHTGKGVKVAVLDSGYDPEHPDLKGVVTASANFTTAPDIRDHTGHGTHVASIVAGSGAASNRRYSGVAPDAEVLVGKVCPDRSCPTSAILQGMEWAAAQGAKVVNLSFGGIDWGWGSDPEKEAIERLTRDNGMLFVAAAGNDGYPGSVNTPSSAPSAISVASVDSRDAMAATSSRGPGISYAVKPDVAAPGDSIVAARAAGTDASGDDPYYTPKGGTSMATPHVSGAAAIVLSRHPDWTPQQVKAALLASARPAADGDVYAQGAGVIDVAKAVDQSILATPATVDFNGIRNNPGDQHRTVTYTNSGSGPVTLDLALHIAGPGGRPRPELMKLDTRQLTVPPGGTGKATVTANLDGLSAVTVGGWITASAGGVTLARTSVGATHRVPTPSVRLTVLNRAGAVDDQSIVRLVNRDSGEVTTLHASNGEYRTTVPEGTYSLLAAILTPGDTAATTSWTLHTRAAIAVRADTELTIDARQAKKLTIDPGAAVTEQYATSVNLDLRLPGGSTGLSVTAGTSPEQPFRDLFVLPGDVDDHLDVTTRSTLVQRVNGDVSRSPAVYHLLLEGHQIPGPAVAIDPAQLASVRTRYAVHTPEVSEVLSTDAFRAGMVGWEGIVAPPLTVLPPLQRTEYFTAAPVGWRQSVCHGPEGESPYRCQWSTIIRRNAGEGVQRWNGAVFGPAVLDDDYPPYRQGGSLYVGATMFSDGSAEHFGDDQTAVPSNSVWVNGELIEHRDGPQPTFDVGTTSGVYRVEQRVARPAGGPAGPTSRQTAAWTFRSDYSEESREVPILVLRFGPDLDLDNRAPAGQPFTIPIRVQRGARAAAAASLTVDVSYDDGATWSSAPVSGSGDTWAAQLTHPEGAEHVALRARAADADGNTVEQTIIGAYGLR